MYIYIYIYTCIYTYIYIYNVIYYNITYTIIPYKKIMEGLGRVAAHGVHELRQPRVDGTQARDELGGPPAARSLEGLGRRGVQDLEVAQPGVVVVARAEAQGRAPCGQALRAALGRGVPRLLLLLSLLLLCLLLALMLLILVSLLSLVVVVVVVVVVSLLVVL